MMAGANEKHKQVSSIISQIQFITLFSLLFWQIHPGGAALLRH
jgi:hypothetical protein